MFTRQRTRCGLLVLALLAALAGAGVWPVDAARAADATMTFTGALNVAGLLSSITVQPSTVTIPAGGEVAFVNGTAVALTVTVGGKSTQVAAGGSASMLFTGADQQQVFPATATALDIPLVGTLTSSVGKVVVRARVAAANDAPAAPRATASSTTAGQASSPSPSAGASDQPLGAVLPVTPSTTPSGTSSVSPKDPTGTTSATGRNHPDKSVDGQRPKNRLNSKVVPEPVLPPFPGFSTRADQLGLVILLAVAVFAGFGAAVLRTVRAYRPRALVGAHSQEARKARRFRRGR